MKTITINMVEYPTYATVEDADTYFSAQFNSGWENIAEDVKSKLLVSATRTIDRMRWLGLRAGKEQTTEFPRLIYGNLTDDNRVLQACCEEALAIHKSGSTTGADTSGIKSMRVQDTEIQFLDNKITKMFQSDVAYDLLKPYLDQGTRILY